MIVGTNGVVVDRSGRILLIRRDDILTWALPGGALDPGELPPAGVVREVEEETRLQVAVERLTGVYYWSTVREEYLAFVFLCRPVGGRPQRTDEALQVGFYRPDRLPWPTLSLHRERIRGAMRHKSGPPNWGRQRPARWLGAAWNTIAPVVYRWQDFRRARLKLPPHVSPRPWSHGAFTIIRDIEDRVLWVKRTDHDVWNLPGGGPVDGEAPWDTAVREALEETGLTVRLLHLSGVYIKPADHRLIFSFLAEAVAGQLTAGPEAAAFDYFSPGQEPENALPKQLQRAADATDTQAATQFRIQDGPPGLTQLGLADQ